MSCEIEKAFSLIRAQLKLSAVPEDSGHAENTLIWLLRLCPEADQALQLAALAHDIERSRANRLSRHDFSDYDAFKALHAAIGARIAARIFREAGVERAIGREACRLIRLHESGGDKRSDLLKDADSISFFDHNLPAYFEREGMDESLRRARWGYARLSARGRDHVARIRHSCPELQRVLASAISTGTFTPSASLTDNGPPKHGGRVRHSASR